MYEDPRGATWEEEGGRECMVVTGHGTARNSLGLERALFRKREKKKVLLMDAS